jgi:hypothetical protein
MSTVTQPVPVSKPMLWGGRVISALVVLFLTMTAVMKFVQPQGMDMDKEIGKLGWKMDQVTTLGTIELVCVIIYAIPQTSILGAILLTGYLGGATATHVRIHDAFVGPIIFGVLVWLGVWLRDPRLRALTPWRK